MKSCIKVEQVDIIGQKKKEQVDIGKRPLHKQSVMFYKKKN